MRRLLLTVGMLFWVIGAVGQTPGADHRCPEHGEDAARQHHAADQHHPANPYAGTPAGLSDAQRAQYLNGEGMGFAKPAEMNHYPGPRHVLQNADRMRLSPEQLAATQELFDAMHQRAVELGKEIVDREDKLVTLFGSHRADASTVQKLTGEIGVLQGELRAAHLLAHLKERALLSPEQVQNYDEARDYVPGEKPAAPSAHQH